MLLYVKSSHKLSTSCVDRFFFLFSLLFSYYCFVYKLFFLTNVYFWYELKIFFGVEETQKNQRIQKGFLKSQVEGMEIDFFCYRELCW